MSVDSAEFHCWYSPDVSSARTKGQSLVEKFGQFLKGPVVDLGCGEGAFLLALADSGKKDILGVESNGELSRIAESFGVPIIRKDILAFLRDHEPKTATYVYVDVIEHLPFDYNIEVLSLIPVGSRLIIQTPYTESLLGHQFYLNVPSHLAPYSPWVIRRMLDGRSYDIVAEGSVDGSHPYTWKRKLRTFLIRRILGVPPELILGGGNFFVVADRNRQKNLSR